MKTKLLFITLFSLVFCLASCNFATAQNLNSIKAKCPTGISGYSTLIAQADGNINAIPCTGRNFQINGTAIPTGTGSTNFLAYWTSANTLNYTPFSWNGTDFTVNNTALNADFRMLFTPAASGAGRFQIGSLSGSALSQLDLVGAAGGRAFLTAASDIQIRDDTSETILQLSGSTDVATLRANNGVILNSRATNTRIGDTTPAGLGTVFQVNDLTQTFSFENTAQTAFIDFVEVQNFNYQRTITASGTTGNQVINKPSGTVNLAAGGTSITITNSTIDASSIVLAIARTNDATCAVKNAVSGAGSVVINMTAACTNETSVGFLVTN
jgi:hypothetical protein